MSTDLYGVHVLEVAPEESRVRFRVYVVYYETGRRTHAGLPDDASFFVCELWRAAEGAPLTWLDPLWMVTTEQICDEGWLSANTHRFVRRIERISTRNHPVPAGNWPLLKDFYYERNGRWTDTHLLVQADFDVHVTDPRHLSALKPGQGWGTTSYAVPSDEVIETEDAVVHLGSPALVLDPFGGEQDDDGTPSDVAFSDDGVFLAVTNQACELVVFRTEDWSEQLRLRESPLWGQDIRWIPGTHRIAGRTIEGVPDTAPGRAFDVDTGTEVDGAPQRPTTPPLLRTREGRKLLDSLSGSHDHAFRPGGEYLVAADDAEFSLWRVEDGELLSRGHTEGEIFRAFAWSPDGETLVASVVTGSQGYGGHFRVYGPGRPEEPEPTTDELRELAAEADPGDALFLLDLIAERETEPAELARLHRDRAKALVHTDPHAAAEALRLSIRLGGATNALHASFDLSILLRDRLGDPDGALEAARTAHGIASGRDLANKKNRAQIARTAVHLADLLRNRHERAGTEEALELYRRAVELDAPKSVAWATLGIGWCLHDLGDEEAAEPSLRAAVEVAGKDAHPIGYAAMLLGGLAKKRRNVPEALTWYQRAFTTDDVHRPLATGHLGELYYLLGERESAVKWYQRMLKATKDPELVAEGCFRIGEFAAADGERAKARTFLRRAIGTGDRKFGAQARELLAGLGS